MINEKCITLTKLIRSQEDDLLGCYSLQIIMFTGACKEYAGLCFDRIASKGEPSVFYCNIITVETSSI